MNRKAKLTRYHGLYKKSFDYELDRCVYCGEPKQTEDHVPPISIVYNLGSDYFIDNDIEFKLYPSCMQCNSMLCNKKLYSIKQRALYIAVRLEKKYTHYLDFAQWTHDELQELGRGLSDYVSTAQDLKTYYERRIDYADNRAASEQF